MTLTLDLTSDLEQRLNRAASQHGIAPERLAVEVLEQHLPASNRGEQLAALLQAWSEEDPQEQKETFEYLVRSLDEGRPDQRKLFPPDLKGVTW
jgi:hypothetical protein